jgi:tetratricopeptide (TPR) repeat protein
MDRKMIKPRNYLYEFLVILNGLVLIGIWWIILQSARKAMLAGCVSYLILAWCLRFTFQKHHMNGMKFLQAKNYSDAAAAFQRSHDFFKKHPSIDKYRFITMFSSSAIPYQQMALNNMGICYLHMGENAKALDAFKKLAELNSNYPHITKAIEEIQKHIDETAMH